MAITVKLYQVGSDPRDIPKVIPDTAVELSGSYRDAPDVIRPVIRCNGHFPGNVNYAYITENNRYYYIRDMEQVTKDITDLTLEVDPLQSWYTLFRNAPIIAARSSSGYNTFIVDGKRLFYAYDSHEYLPLTFSYQSFGNTYEATEARMSSGKLVVMTVG